MASLPWASVVDDDDAHVQLQVPRFRGLTIHRRGKPSRVPTTAAELAAPLKAVGVETVALGKVLAAMQPDKRARFELLFNMPRKFRPTRPESFDALADADGNALVAAGLAEPAANTSNIGLCHAFSVVQEKQPGQLARRFILHPAALNEFLADELGYVADVPLPHVSALLPAAHDEHATTHDFKSGFHQVALPKDMRHLFRFRCSDGRVLQLTRLPMGLRTAPELFQILASTIAGDRLYCTGAWAAPASVHLDVWIDNVRFCGPRSDVARHTSTFCDRCKAVGATLNADDETSGSSYVFCGVQFRPGTVAVAEKTRAKIAAAVPLIESGSITIADLESLFGRLWFAASILGISARDFWWAIKVARRRLAAVNNDPSLLDSRANLSPASRAQLLEWARRAAGNTPRAPPRRNAPAPSARLTLFTDATPEGWGAVLIDDATQSVVIAGGNFGQRADNINAAETRAVACALEAFKARVPRGAHLHLRIDNTSAAAAVVKGRTDSGAINTELQRVFDRLTAVTVTVEYIRSEDNFGADGASRSTHLFAGGRQLAMDTATFNSRAWLRDQVGTAKSRVA